jgi:hypothetical protein
MLTALLAGKSIPDAAAAAGCSRRTGYRIAARENFQNALTVARSEMLTSVIDALRSKARDAVDTLAEISADPKPAPQSQARVSASREVLANLFRGIELFDIEIRLRKLESAVGAEVQK